MSMTQRILEVMSDGLPRSSEEIAQEVNEKWVRVRKAVVNHCCDGFMVAKPVHYSLAPDGFRRLNVVPRSRDENCLTRRILQSLGDGSSNTVCGLANDLDANLESVQMLMSALLYRKALKSVPVTYQITAKGSLRASKPAVRRFSDIAPPPNIHLVSMAMASQPALMRVWG